MPWVGADDTRPPPGSGHVQVKIAIADVPVAYNIHAVCLAPACCLEPRLNGVGEGGKEGGSGP
jgi:hypothetical protein